ncbi:ABC transporter substrate-binding protein [Alkalibacterium psychrotolerans]
MKKIVFVSLSLLTLAACNNTQEESDTSNGTNDSAEPIEVVWSHGSDSTGTYARLVEAFNESQSEVIVTEIEQPSGSDGQHDDLVIKMNASDTTVDIFNMDIVWPPEFGSAGWAEPLNEYFTDEEIEEFLPGPIEGNTWDDQLYSMPLFTDAGVLFYRTDILEENNLEAPSTFEEFYTMAEELSGEETTYGFVFQGNQYEGLVTNALEYMWGNGGTVLNDAGEVEINSENNIEALEFLIDITEADFTPSGVTTYQEDDGRTMFVEGDSVFLRNWPFVWALSQEDDSPVKDNVGMAPMPVGPSGDEPAATLGGWNLGINTHIDDEKKDASAEFLRFVASDEGQRIIADTGRLPVIDSVYQDEDILNDYPHFEQLYDVLINAKPRPVSPVYPRISDIMQIEIHRAITGDISAREAVETMQERIEDLIN